MAGNNNRIRLTSFRPVVSSTALAEDEVVRSEQVAEGTRPYRVHGTGLEIDEDGARDILVAGGLCDNALARPQRQQQTVLQMANDLAVDLPR